jgi:hypothetical protein
VLAALQHEGPLAWSDANGLRQQPEAECLRVCRLATKKAVSLISVDQIEPEQLLKHECHRAQLRPAHLAPDGDGDDDQPGPTCKNAKA